MKQLSKGFYHWNQIVVPWHLNAKLLYAWALSSILFYVIAIFIDFFLSSIKGDPETVSWYWSTISIIFLVIFLMVLAGNYVAGWIVDRHRGPNISGTRAAQERNSHKVGHYKNGPKRFYTCQPFEYILCPCIQGSNYIFVMAFLLLNMSRHLSF